MDFNILTFHSALNHGAVLQAFALQTFIESLGYEAGVYDYRPSTAGRYAGFKGKLFKAIRKLDESDYLKKEKRFSEFVENYLHLNTEQNPKVFLAGSDQVWNTASLNPMYFLRFASADIVKASYAASMASSDIPETKKDKLSRYLRTIDFLSVRENGIKNSLGKLTDKPISVNIDPTFLLSHSKWESVMSPVMGIPDKYTLVYIMHLSKNVNKLLKWLKKETGDKIIVIDGQGTVQGKLTALVYNDIALHDVGPREFLWLMAHAQRIVTSSFHGTAFSIIFRKEFYSIVNPAAPSRIHSLLELLGLQEVSELEENFDRNINIDWNRVSDILAEEIESSKQYLNKVYQKGLQKKSTRLNGDIAGVVQEGSCAGCTACASVCPCDAISMQISDMGFLRPILDRDKCIGCSKCINTCPVENFNGLVRKKAVYGWNKSADILMKSSSGGAFRAIADKVLSDDGIVYGASFADDYRTVVFVDSDNVPLEKMQKSKYTVSNPTGIFRKIKEDLHAHRKVLFCGTPCQCAGLRMYLNGKSEDLITVDFVCGGMASLKFWNEHLDQIEVRSKSKIKLVDFRPKDYGWGRYYIQYVYNTGRKVITREYNDTYFKCFADEHISVSRNCLECDFHALHAADITIADFWGYKSAHLEVNHDGTSMIIANSEKGIEMLERLDNLEMYELPLPLTDYAFGANNPSASKLKLHREYFDRCMQEGFEKVSREMFGVGVVSQTKKWVKNKVKR